MKLYRWSIILALCILCVHSVLLPVQVDAAEGDRMEIKTDGIVTLHSQQAADAGVSSLQFTMQVDADNKSSISVDFVPDGKLDAVVESFWHADSGELNVYIAGSRVLFDNGQAYTLTLGRVTATDGRGRAVRVELRADESSLFYVVGTEMVAAEDLTVPADPVVLNADTASGGGSAGTTGWGTGSLGGTAGSGESAGANAAGSGSDSGRVGSASNTSGSAGGQMTGTDGDESGAEDAARNLHTRLLTVLNTAEQLREQDYTKESYQGLKDAIEQAELLLNAPDASREDVEDAILALENAMGALVGASEATVESEGDTEDAAGEEHAGIGFRIILLLVIIAAAVLGIGGIVMVQLRDHRDSL